MSRYYMDTNVLLGLTFLQNRWRPHSERLIDSDNTIYISDKVLFEYCAKRRDVTRRDAHISWQNDDGKFSDEKMRLRRDVRQCSRELDTLEDDEITAESVAEIIFEEHDVENQVKPLIKTYFDIKLEKDCSRQSAKQALKDLRNRITSKADERKEMLSDRVKYIPVGNNCYPEIRKRVARMMTKGSEESHPDAEVIADAYSLKEDSIVSQVVTGDKGDIYLNREEIHTITGLRVQYLKDKFAVPTQDT